MKKLIYTLSLLFISNLTFAQVVNEKKVESTISDVTVFVTGGEVHREAKVDVKKGRNRLIFTRISTVADHKSVQFNADNEFNLVSVSSEVDYLSFIDNNPRIQLIQDTLLVLNDKIIDLNNDKSAYNDEQSLLLKNNDIKGTQSN